MSTIDTAVMRVAPPVPRGESRALLAGLSLCVLLSSLGTSIANVALPTLATAFEASFTHVQWVVLAYLLAITGLVVVAGRLGDAFGRRGMLVVGIGLFMVGSTLAGIAPTLWVLVAARAVQGAGAALMLALAMAAVPDAVPKERTGLAMGLLGTMSAVGTALGPVLGGLLIGSLGWRAVFLVNIPFGIVALWLAWCFLPRARVYAGNANGFDAMGMLALIATLSALAIVITPGPDGMGWLQLVAALVAILGLAVFLRIEATVAVPLVRLGLLREPVAGKGMVMNLLAAAVVMTTLIVGPFHLAGALGLSVVETGVAMSCGPIVAALAGVPAGRAVDRLGDRHGALVGLTAMLIGCALLAAAPLRFGVAGYVVPLMVLTAGYALFQAGNNTAVMGGSLPGERGLVSGLLNLSRNLGLVIGASAMGTVFTLATATAAASGTGPTTSIAIGTTLAFAVASVLVALALAIGVWFTPAAASR